MVRPREMTRETFLRVAQQVGLDTKAPYMEQLYSHVQNIHRMITALDEIEVGEGEPAATFAPSKE